MATFEEIIFELGFNEATAEILLNQGLDSAASLVTLTETQIDDMIRHVSRAYPPPQAAFPFLSVQKLKAFRYWFAMKTRIGVLPINLDDFDDEQAAITRSHMTYEQGMKQAEKIAKPTNPSVLKDGSKNWLVWKEEWKTYISQVRGVALIPLLYVCRSHEVPTPEMYEKVYRNEDDRLHDLTTLYGEHYDSDNRHTYTLLKDNLVTTASWTFIKRFDSDMDGRGAFLALVKQYEGVTAALTRTNAAYAMINTSSFKGTTKNFTFQHYVTVHQKAYNELDELGEPVSQKKRVTDFLARISDPTLAMAKQIILGDPHKLEDLEDCQQYLSSILASNDNAKKNARFISSISTGGAPNAKKAKKVVDKFYTTEEWEKLGHAGRESVLKLREKKGKSTYRSRSDYTGRGGRGAGSSSRGGRGGGRGRGGGGRSVSETNSVAEDNSTIATDEQSTSNTTASASTGSSSNSRGGNAGNQFGRSAHSASSRNN